MITTLERWRKEMPPEFEFTLKAWQLITHTSKSPTFKRLRRRLTESEFNEAGSFSPTAIVKEAWEITLACARALEARTVLFQCPASFVPSKVHIRNLETFFTSVDRGGLNFCWEPRGDWDDSTIRRLCERLDLWHVADPFARATVTPDRCYFRLHGRIRWRYEYEDGELEELATLLPSDRPSYVFFNNITMLRDAERFQQMVRANEAGS